MDRYELAKNNFMDYFAKHKNNELNTKDYNNIIKNIVIPNFELLACDIDSIIFNLDSEDINSFINFLEIIFNYNLYESILSSISKDDKEVYIHYMIILIEVSKYEAYININNKLETIGNDIFKETVYYSILKTSTDESINKCLSIIRRIYKSLDDYPLLDNCRNACDELLSNQNIKL